MIRKTLAMGGCAWSTSEARSSVGGRDFDYDGGPVSFCWTWLHWRSTSGRDGEIASFSWSTDK